MTQAKLNLQPQSQTTSTEVSVKGLRCSWLFVFFSIMTWLTPLATWGANGDESEKPTTLEFKGVEIKDRLGAQVPLNLTFKNEEGQKVTLSQYFNQDKPILLTMVYYNCPMLCSLVLNGAIDGLKELGWVPGDNFEAITVSISPVETPDLAVTKKNNYMRQLGIVGADKGWHFLTGDQPQIKALAESIGFGYRYDPSTQDYAHGAALFFISPTGKLTRLLKGIQFEPKELRLSFVEASEGKIGSIFDQLLLRCFRYEPSSKKYAFYIWGTVRLGGIFTIFGIAILLLIMWRGERNRTHATSGLGSDLPSTTT